MHELSEFVAPDHIPKELGGQEDFEYHYIEPSKGENKEMEDARRDGRLAKLEEERRGIVENFEKETIKWCRGEGGDDVGAVPPRVLGAVRRGVRRVHGARVRPPRSCGAPARCGAVGAAVAEVVAADPLVLEPAVAGRLEGRARRRGARRRHQ